MRAAMIRLLIAAAALAACASYGQVYRCTGASGRVVYTDEPCAGATQLDPAYLKGNTTQGLRQRNEIAPEQAGSNAPATSVNQDRAGVQSGVCPTPQQVANIETAATSIRLRDQWEELRFLREEVERARQCSPNMRYTQQDWNDLEAYRQYQHRLDPRDRAEARRAALRIHRRAR